MSNAQLTQEQKLAQFNALLDVGFEEIEDLPEYATFEPGAYNFRGASAKIDTEKGFIRMTFEKLSLVELDEQAGGESEKVPVDGALLGVSFFGKFGIQRMKKVFANVRTQLGAENVTQLVDQFENLNFVAVVSKRKDKDSEKYYNDIVEITLAP